MKKKSILNESLLRTAHKNSSWQILRIRYKIFHNIAFH